MGKNKKQNETTKIIAFLYTSKNQPDKEKLREKSIFQIARRSPKCLGICLTKDA